MRINWLGRCGCGGCGCGLFAALAILGKRLAGEHDGLRCGAIECCSLTVGWGFFYAIERGFGSEATRNPGGALIPVAATAAAVSAVSTITVVACPAVTAVILRNRRGIGIGDWCGRVRDRLFGCTVDIV